MARHCMLAGLASTQLTSKSGSTSSAHQRNAIRMVFRIWADNGLCGLASKNGGFALCLTVCYKGYCKTEQMRLKSNMRTMDAFEVQSNLIFAGC